MKSKKCYEIKDCPFNNTDPRTSKCPPHQLQIGCYEYDWVSYYNKMPDCNEKKEWKEFMLVSCINCVVCDNQKDKIFEMLERLRKA